MPNQTTTQYDEDLNNTWGQYKKKKHKPEKARKSWDIHEMMPAEPRTLPIQNAGTASNRVLANPDAEHYLSVVQSYKMRSVGIIGTIIILYIVLTTVCMFLNYTIIPVVILGVTFLFLVSPIKSA